MQKPTEKQPISAKVTHETKERIIQQAKDKGQTTSEYVASILTSYDEQEKKKKEELDRLHQEIKEKNELTANLTARLEQAQVALNQQQQLQLMVQKQVEDMQRSNQLLLEENTKKSRKWWQLWEKK